MSSKTILRAFQLLCGELDTKASHHMKDLLLSGQHLAFVSEAIDMDDYGPGDVSRFRDDYLVYEYLSKYKGLQTGIDTKQVALDSFKTAENQCSDANDRIDAFLYRNGSCDWAHVLCMAQQKIESCIGPYPKASKFIDRYRWGKGATFSLKGEDARLDYKLCEEQISVTKKALPYLRAAMATDYAWLHARGLDVVGPTSLLDNEFQVVEGSRGVTVDKNAKTDRFIAAEPSGNIFLQLGVGGYFRQCLQRIGINLDDQSINQGLAAQALDRGLATVDLKAASDTISRGVVWLLLPYSWASFLNDLRSHRMFVDGHWTIMEKFSSMGNGFTFELESLIFWALTEALRDYMGVAGRVSVYGDDIICPAVCVPNLQSLLEWCGFTFNVKKTHYTGLFRESCGKHYYEGKDVTPIYQKSDPEQSREEFYRCHNRLLYHAIDRGHETDSGVLADCKFRELIKYLRRRYDELYPKGKAHLVPISSHAQRELEGGFAVCSRALPLANLVGRQGKSFPEGKVVWSQAWVFKPRVLPDSNDDALYAVSLRRGYGHAALTVRYRRCLYKTHVDSAICVGVWVLGDAPRFSILADELTARRQGRYRTQVRYYPETRDLHWI